MLNSTPETARSVRALHRVLIKTRHLALQGAAVERLIGLLDWAEWPDDIASSEDDFRQFTQHLEGLGEDDPDFAGILHDYNAERAKA